jgi:hypothetical protein
VADPKVVNALGQRLDLQSAAVKLKRHVGHNPRISNRGSWQR